MDEKKKLCGEAVREIIKIFASKGLNHKGAQSVLGAVSAHLRNTTEKNRVEDTSTEINTNFINCNF